MGERSERKGEQMNERERERQGSKAGYEYLMVTSYGAGAGVVFSISP